VGESVERDIGVCDEHSGCFYLRWGKTGEGSRRVGEVVREGFGSLICIGEREIWIRGIHREGRERLGRVYL